MLPAYVLTDFVFQPNPIVENKGKKKILFLPAELWLEESTYEKLKGKVS